MIITLTEKRKRHKDIYRQADMLADALKRINPEITINLSKEEFEIFASTKHGEMPNEEEELEIERINAIFEAPESEEQNKQED